MNKKMSMIFLLAVLIMAFMFKIIMGDYMLESFASNKQYKSLGKDLDYKPQSTFPNGNLFGNMRYPGKAYLSIAEPKRYLYENKSDDTSIDFGFPFFS